MFVRRKWLQDWSRIAVFIFSCMAPYFVCAHDGSLDHSADHQAEVQAALRWLESSQQVSGVLASEFEDATDSQATAEALRVLASLGSDAVDVAAALTVLEDSPERMVTDQLARLVISYSDTGLAGGDVVRELRNRQASDGGFGDFPGYQSTPLDTAYALLALQTSGQDAAIASRALSYLLSEQLPTGGFGYYGDQSSAMVTALVVKAVTPYLYTFNISALLSQAIDFLYAVEGPDRRWGSDWESALALQALIPLSTDVALYDSAVTALWARQQSSGSWGEQVYSTALALAALDLLANPDVPVDPEKALIKGRLIDGVSGGVPADAVIDVRDTESERVTLDRDGQFSISNLGPGSYIVSYSAPGYLGASQSLSLQQGQFADVGTISLSVAPGATLISGTLTDSATGAPLVGATVTVTIDGHSSTAVSDENGQYLLLSEVGEATLTVSSTNYYQVSAKVELAAGTVISFSPELRPNTEEQATSASIGGMVVDTDGLPLAGVQIDLLGGEGSATTASDGRFFVSGLDAGEVRLNIVKSGFATLVVNLIVPEKTQVNLGVVRMSEQSDLASTSLTGQVLDSGTGLPVAGANVSAGLQSTTSDNNGFYRLSDIPLLEFTVKVRTAGYLFTNKDISLSEHRNLTLNISIRKADLGGVTVAGLASDAASYGAYQPVLITADLENNNALTQRARLYVKVANSAGNTVANFSAGYLPPLDSAMDDEELAHYQQHLEETIEELAPGEQRQVAPEQWWNTQNSPPGNYVITVQAVDAATSNLVSEKSIVIEVVATTRLASLKAIATPGYALLNGKAEIALAADLLNRSNVDTNLTFDYVIADSQGQSLLAARAEIPLAPTATNVRAELGRLLHRFVESGDYVLEFSGIAGAEIAELSHATLLVPPSIRLDILQSVSPIEVVPLDGVSVKSIIQVKGVDGE